MANASTTKQAIDEVIHNQQTLENDADFSKPLQRVFYDSGMMLGLDAIQDEQDYHRSRLNRHQYWLHGAGTIAGMSVSLQHIQPQPEVTESVRIIVKPGIGIDALGRDVLINEPYCIPFNEWLASQNPASLLNGYDAASETLTLKITIRQNECLKSFQPVLARKLNASTDAVQPNRNQDSILLELTPYTPKQNTDFKPWAAHENIGNLIPLEDLLTSDEMDFINNADPADQKELKLQARLLHSYQDDNSGLESDFNELARIFLAQVSLVNVTDINNIILDPINIKVNSLLRPFVKTAEIQHYFNQSS
ncbi:MAG: hypothetical protein GY694_06990 [Gammaproteobacteria bacterium]|nr:hypothetical protein [Gammaproteobacteria bacterium]